ncbi:PAS domain-containing protein [Palleronia aestuarii]|uniref:PAS domain-containing protein n=1 Tax=Palleronia aestuarii TaxID=568105 RepID=A0A2W7NAX1_9RHOB|nr:PAS domain-containing protein [Palleronia aestuarii]PZX17565.1 PAS domain-containing protein [Palleronia aestuarii]
MEDESKIGTPKVVSIAKFRTDPATECQNALRTYWEALCNGRIMPDRHDVDPRGLSDILDKVFLIERIAPRQAQFRVAGQHLAQTHGFDLRGMPVSTIFTAAARARLEDALQALFDEPAEITLELMGPRTGFFTRITAHLTLLPLRGPDGEVTRAIGCFQATGSGRESSAPRFDIANEERRTLIGYADPERQPIGGAPGVFSGADAMRASQHRKAGDRPALRLVTSN